MKLSKRSLIIFCLFTSNISGIDVVDRGCCGTGNIEVSVLCNRYAQTCPDDSKFLFWDSYHPTEKGYSIIVSQIIKKYINSFL